MLSICPRLPSKETSQNSQWASIALKQSPSVCLSISTTYTSHKTKQRALLFIIVVCFDWAALAHKGWEGGGKKTALQCYSWHLPAYSFQTKKSLKSKLKEHAKAALPLGEISHVIHRDMQRTMNTGGRVDHYNCFSNPAAQVPLGNINLLHWVLP